MKILVLSDSHSAFGFMRSCIQATTPDAMIHLGDYYPDGETMAEEYPHIPMYQVPGNCDLHRYFIPDPEIRIIELDGVRLYLTHGHRHGVKQSLLRLKADAKAANAQAALFGHTHAAHCQQEDGLWMINPGACSWGGSAALLEIKAGRILQCRFLRPDTLKDL